MFRMFLNGNPFRQATQGLAKGALITGLFLIGFGMLVFVLRDLFAFIAAAIFFYGRLFCNRLRPSFIHPAMEDAKSKGSLP